ncbi:OLC1v1038956C3 [Oldenlandia corymbosa var. corymbosa]|uniref:OLC1v1038956C3 n=2 Tax=Oldenlandia corymbosa var. corymbosa TaxID=529605 RepID=A0AAV1D0Z3_OLDCO|nr:OLC1v1038956C3 [Oldenlandia corymbosa var. corymbosa]
MRQQNHIVQEKTKKNLATAKQTTNIEILNTIAATSSVSTMQPGHLVNPGASSSSGHSSSLPAFDQLKINLQQVTTPAKPNPGRINRSQRVQQQIALRQQIALQRDKLSRAMNRSNQSSMMAAGQNANHQPVSSFPMVANNSSPVDKSGIQIQYGSGKQSSSAPASASATGGYRGNPQSLLHSQTKFVQNQMPMPRQEQVAQRRQTMSSNPLFPPITQHISPNSSSVAKGAQIGWDETQQIQHVRNPSTSQQSLLVKTSDGVSGNPSTSCTKIVKQTPEDLAEEATQLSWFVARNDYLEKKVYRFETELSQLVSRNAYLEKRVSRLDTQLSQLVSCNAYLEKVGKMKKAEPSSVLGKKLAKIQSIKQQSSSKVEAESNYKTPPVSNLQSESEANKEEAENNVKETDPGVDLGKKMDTTQPIKQQSSPASNLPKSEAEVKEEEVDKNAKETDPGS